MSSTIVNKRKNTLKDLTVGSTYGCIVSFAIPMFLGMLFQQMYSMIDAMIVGKLLGWQQLAGVGATGSICFFIFGFCQGLSNGFAIPVAQMYGARKESELRRYVTNTVWLGIIFAVVLTTCTIIFCQRILLAMKTPDDVIDYSYNYLILLFAGIPFTILYNSVAAIIRALGDSRTPVVFLAISSVINIGLDVLFIKTFGMDVEGAALATLISQAISGVACLIYMKKSFAILKADRAEWRFDWTYGKKLCLMGVPMGLQYSITAIGTIVLQKAVNGCGSLAVAGATAAQKLNGIITCPIEALASTMATYVGQNVGAKKIERIGQGLRNATFLGFIISAIMCLIVYFIGKPASLLFLNKDEADAISYSFKYIFISSMFYCLLVMVGNFRFSIQGMGYSGFAVIAGVLEMVARIFVAMFFAKWFGFTGLCFASPVAWAAADAFLIPAFIYSRKRLTKELYRQER